MQWYYGVWYTILYYGMVLWYGMVWYGMVWYGMVWYCMVYGMVWFAENIGEFPRVSREGLFNFVCHTQCKMAAAKSVLGRNFLNSVRCFCGVNVLSRRYASTDTTFHPRRSLLYIPGNDERKIKKASSLNADIVVLDCEDGVALNRKVCILKGMHMYIEGYDTPSLPTMENHVGENSLGRKNETILY